jgi:hypothetical protein
MSAAAIAQYLEWLGIVCSVLVAAGLIVQALLITPARRFRGWLLVVVALVDLVAVFALYWFTDVFLNPWWMAGLLAIGVGVGWVIGRGTKVAVKDGGAYAKLSPIPPWLVAVSLSASVAAMFFASVGTFALALLGSLFAVGMLLGQAVAASVAIAGARTTPSVSAITPPVAEQA